MSKIPQEAIEAAEKSLSHEAVWVGRETLIRALEAADAARAQGADVEPLCNLVWRQGFLAVDDVVDYFEVARPGDKSVDGSDPFPVYTTPPAPQPTDREKVLEEIAAERARQISDEGWTPEHDDQHDTGQMAEAAASYALKSTGRHGNPKYPPSVWPCEWDIVWWKPTTPRRDLVKAAALLVAEIERLDRAALAGGDA